MQPGRKLSPVIIALIVIVLIGTAVAAVVIAKQPKETAVIGTQSAIAASQQKGSYKDGTYSDMGRYASPGGGESIDVTVTIANNIIASASVTGNATSRDAKEYQAAFISGYKSSVVGKNIDEVSLSRVAGSSLTSTGFNTALELIKADARA